MSFGLLYKAASVFGFQKNLRYVSDMSIKINCLLNMSHSSDISVQQVCSYPHTALG